MPGCPERKMRSGDANSIMNTWPQGHILRSPCRSQGWKHRREQLPEGDTFREAKFLTLLRVPAGPELAPKVPGWNLPRNQELSCLSTGPFSHLSLNHSSIFEGCRFLSWIQNFRVRIYGSAAGDLLLYKICSVILNSYQLTLKSHLLPVEVISHCGQMAKHQQFQPGTWLLSR